MVVKDSGLAKRATNREESWGVHEPELALHPRPLPVPLESRRRVETETRPAARTA